MSTPNEHIAAGFEPPNATPSAPSKTGEDTELLDWLEEHLCYPMVCLNGRSMELLKNNGRGWHNGELRSAIRAARQQTQST